MARRLPRQGSGPTGIDLEPAEEEKCRPDTPCRSGEQKRCDQREPDAQPVDKPQIDCVWDERPQPQERCGSKIHGCTLGAHDVVSDERERREQGHKPGNEEILRVGQERDQKNCQRTEHAFQEQRHHAPAYMPNT